VNEDEQIKKLIDDGDPQTAAIGATVRELADKIAEDGWDQPPTLWAISRQLPPEQLADDLAELGVAAQVMLTMPVLTLPGGGAGIASFLAAMGAAFAEGWKGGPVDDLVAWMVSYEAWTVATADADEETAAGMWADAAAHRLGERADRVECRMMLALDRTGTCYSMVVPRGPAKTLPHPGELQVLRDGEMDGRIWQALTVLMDATP
jgi:hypothetical protein